MAGLPVRVVLRLLLLTPVALRPSYAFILRLTIEVVILARRADPSSIREVKLLFRSRFLFGRRTEDRGAG